MFLITDVLFISLLLLILDRERMDNQHLVEQLERQFTVREFVDVAQHLMHSLNISTTLNLEDIYRHFENQDGKVVGKHVLKFVQNIRHEAQDDTLLHNEIGFYKDKIHQLQSKGISQLAPAQFVDIFLENNPYRGLVSQGISEYVAAQNVEIEVLNGLIDRLLNFRENQHYLSQRSTAKKQKQKQPETLPTESGQTDLLNTIGDILYYHIKDSTQFQKVESLLEQIKQKSQQNTKMLVFLQQQNLHISQKLQSAVEQIDRLQNLIAHKDHLISQLHHQQEVYEQEIQLFENQCQQDFISTITSLTNQNQRLNCQNQDMRDLCSSLNLKLEEIQDVQLVPEKKGQFGGEFGCSVCEKWSMHERDNRDNRQHETEIIESLKEQINEAYQKISQLRNKNKQLENTVNDLQLQIQQKCPNQNPLTQRTFRNLALDQQIPICLQLDPKDSFLELLRKKSFNDDIVEQLAIDERKYSIQLIRSITKLYFTSDRKTEKGYQTEHREGETESPCKNQGNLKVDRKYSVREFDYADFLNESIMKDVTCLVQSFDTSNPIEPIFSSKVRRITPNGPQSPEVLVINSTKLQLWKQNFTQLFFTCSLAEIEEICLCQNMRSWFLLKLKPKTSKIDGKMEQEFVLQSLHRAELVKFLVKKAVCCNRNKVMLRVVSEENQVVEWKGIKKNLASFTGFKNSIDISLNDGQNVFQAKIKEYFVLLEITIKVTIVVNELGLLVFETNSYPFDEKLKLKYLLPFCPSMEIIISGKKSIKIVYPSEKSIFIEFDSHTMTKLAQSRIIFHKNQQSRNRKTEDQKTVAMLTGLEKLRTVQFQDML